MIVTAAAVVVAVGVIWRQAIRPVVRGVGAVQRIVERELTHNSGNSVKDHAKQAADESAELKAKVAALDVKLSETRHDIIGKVAVVRGTVDGASTLVDAIVATAEELRAVREDLARLRPEGS